MLVELIANKWQLELFLSSLPAFDKVFPGYTGKIICNNLGKKFCEVIKKGHLTQCDIVQPVAFKTFWISNNIGCKL